MLERTRAITPGELEAVSQVILLRLLLSIGPLSFLFLHTLVPGVDQAGTPVWLAVVAWLLWVLLLMPARHLAVTWSICAQRPVGAGGRKGFALKFAALAPSSLHAPTTCLVQLLAGLGLAAPVFDAALLAPTLMLLAGVVVWDALLEHLAHRVYYLHTVDPSVERPPSPQLIVCVLHFPEGFPW